MSLAIAVNPADLAPERSTLKGLVTLHPNEITRDVRPGTYAYLTTRAGYELARLDGVQYFAELEDEEILSSEYYGNIDEIETPTRCVYVFTCIQDSTVRRIADPRMVAFVLQAETIEQTPRNARR